MWYISSPEKSVVPWSSGNGVYPSLAVSDGGDNVMVEPGPAIFYLTNPSNSDGEDILIGSAPLGVPTAYGNGIQPSFILPDAGKDCYICAGFNATQSLVFGASFRQK